MPAAKRSAEPNVTNGMSSPPAKKPHPFFTGGGGGGGAALTSLGTFQPSPPTLVHYTHLDPLAPSSSKLESDCAGGSEKVAITFYDLDGTLVKPRLGGQFPKSRDDWMWWHPSVPDYLRKEHEAGRHLVVISNQGDPREKIKSEWRAKLPLIAAKLPKDIPIRVLAALSKTDIYRKPNIGMYEVIERLYRSKGLEIDLEKSIFVGDAAGRLGTASASKSAKGKGKGSYVGGDHGDTDYKFALNVGLRFVTPEEHFLGHARPKFPEPPNGFVPSKLGNLARLPHIVPSHTPIVPHPLPPSNPGESPTALAAVRPEIVLFVGPPASGKSSFFARHFAPEGYVHINQDLLGTRDRCMRAAESALAQGRRVVVDNTNRNKETRALWVKLAAKFDVPIRLFHFLCPIELAKHNNIYRAIYCSEPTLPQVSASASAPAPARKVSTPKATSAPPAASAPRAILPPIAFTSYASSFEQPTKEEGFDEIRGVNFHFEGTAEMRRKWDLYMLEPRR